MTRLLRGAVAWPLAIGLTGVVVLLYIPAAFLLPLPRLRKFDELICETFDRIGDWYDGPL